MRYVLGFLLSIASQLAIADCKSFLPLEGVTSIDTCDPQTEKCVPAAKALYTYMDKAKDDPSVVTVALHASPWRFYDPEMRILSVEEVAEMLRSHLTKGVKRIHLTASWTGIAPSPGQQSLAQRLSEQLKGFPVEGENGFLWISKKGATRTTHQAFTVTRGSRPYGIRDGDEVMVSFVAGWPATFEESFVKERNADGVMRAGAGWDIFFLCPDRALQSFEAAARLSNPIAAYNAAMLRLERKDKGDAEAASVLLKQAAEAGDSKAIARLNALKSQSQ